MKAFKFAAAVLSAVALLGCGDATMEVGGVSEKDDLYGESLGREAWSAADAPTLFNSNLEFKLDALPMEGQATNIPWAGNYWPVYEDSINVKWDGETSMSAAEKYGKAFNVADVENKVSKYHGIDNATAQKECSQTSECNAELGEQCAKRRGAEKGRCIPTWWRICHAWSPAAILMPEPKRPVTRNGVTFKVNDIKALVTLVHNKTTSNFVSLRCNKSNSQGQVTYDPSGRPTDSSAECRDTNAGTFHILLANYLGVMKQAFVEDRTFDHEVWNQPLRGYKIHEKREVTMVEANKLIGASLVGGTTTTKSGTVAKEAWVHQEPLTVAAGQSVKIMMTGSGDADLYAKFGAQPTASAYDCLPYEGGSAETCDLTVPANTTQLFVSVQGYADTSNFSLTMTVGGAAPTTYVFNAKAKKFVYVRSEVKYISESSAQTDGNLAQTIDRYTGTDNYEYILELDDAGKIIGGEWVGASQKAHPDFVWLPTGVSGTSVAGGAITYAQVKSLLDESVQEVGVVPAGEKVVEQNGTVTKNQLTIYGPFKVAEGSQLSAVLSGSGDADLYVKKGQKPTLTAYDCRPYKSGSSALRRAARSRVRARSGSA